MWNHYRFQRAERTTSGGGGWRERERKMEFVLASCANNHPIAISKAISTLLFFPFASCCKHLLFRHPKPSHYSQSLLPEWIWFSRSLSLARAVSMRDMLRQSSLNYISLVSLSVYTVWCRVIFIWNAHSVHFPFSFFLLASQRFIRRHPPKPKIIATSEHPFSPSTIKHVRNIKFSTLRRK